MLDLSKSYEFFDPELVKGRVHIIGCGSVGSTLAENLVRCGITKITLWDFDAVEPKNIVNQMFRQKDIGKFKVDALSEILEEINPDIKNDIRVKPDGWSGNPLGGYVFLCVDNIELRKEIVEKNFHNLQVKAMFDFRTTLESAQHYGSDWRVLKEKETFLNSMQFSHDEATDETPVSACGITLGVATTVRLICALGVNNFINYLKGQGIQRFVMIDGFKFMLDSFVGNSK